MRRKRNNKQIKFIMITSVSLLFILTVGYAAFSTNLNITAKGNVKKMTAAKQLQSTVVTSGDGLYNDIYENERYVYKGTNPNNYIKFNNELWRIVSVELDGSLKIVKVESVAVKAWDESNLNDWDRPATLNTYLNSTYYNDNTKLSSEAKSLIQEHSWGIGKISPENTDLAEQVQMENGTIWTGYVGLVSASDVIRANSNVSSCGTLNLHRVNKDICKTTNYMVPSSGYSYTISSSNETADDAVCTAYTGNIGRDDAIIAAGIYPTVYLKSDIKLSGEGTEINPYEIN